MFRRWFSSHLSVLVFTVVLTAVVATFFLYPYFRDRVVSAREQTAPGTIVAHEPAHHSRYGYTFTVNQKTYSGWEVPRDAENFTVGQVVTVHYDPLDPTNNALVDFSEVADRELGPVPLLLAVIPFVLLIGFLRRRAKPKATSVVSG